MDQKAIVNEIFRLRDEMDALTKHAMLLSTEMQAVRDQLEEARACLTEEGNRLYQDYLAWY